MDRATSSSFARPLLDESWLVVVDLFTPHYDVGPPHISNKAPSSNPSIVIGQIDGTNANPIDDSSSSSSLQYVPSSPHWMSDLETPILHLKCRSMMTLL
jgi:hypothetical protein